MADTIKYPRAPYRYKMTLGSLEGAWFMEVSCFDAATDSVAYREGNRETETLPKAAGCRKYGNITLKNGVIKDQELYDWLTAGLTGAVTKQSVTISLISEDQSEIAAWQAINVWPVKYTAPDFCAASSEIAIESLELAHEGLTRTE